MQSGIVLVAHRGGDAALSEEARRPQERALREDEHVALARRAQRREQARDAAPDDDDADLPAATRISTLLHGSFRL
jgi:hypothetical protein